MPSNKCDKNSQVMLAELNDNFDLVFDLVFVLQVKTRFFLCFLFWLIFFFKVKVA